MGIFDSPPSYMGLVIGFTKPDGKVLQSSLHIIISYYCGRWMTLYIQVYTALYVQDIFAGTLYKQCKARLTKVCNLGPAGSLVVLFRLGLDNGYALFMLWSTMFGLVDFVWKG